MIKNYKLPKSWEIKELGKVCEIIMGQSPESSSYNELHYCRREGLAQATPAPPVAGG